MTYSNLTNVVMPRRPRGSYIGLTYATSGRQKQTASHLARNHRQDRTMFIHRILKELCGRPGGGYASVWRLGDDEVSNFKV